MGVSIQEGIGDFVVLIFAAVSVGRTGGGSVLGRIVGDKR